LHLRTEPEAIRFDLALTVSVVRYISDVSSGRVDPAVFSFGLHFDQTKCDLAEALRALINSRDVVAELNQLEPPFEGYWRTQKALARYLALAREDTDPPGLPRVERLLRLVGDLGPSDALMDGVKRFPIRHGIEPDGRIGKDTLKQQYRPELEMKVVVGKAYHHKTPVSSNEMTHVIFRPQHPAS
jgi:L,D-transpeptidase YcbB